MSDRSTITPDSVAASTGGGPIQAWIRPSSPLRKRWQRTPPVARPLGGYSENGVTLTDAPPVPGSAPDRPATVTTTASPEEPDEPDAGPRAPNQIAVAPSDRRMPVMPPAWRPCGRTAEAGNRSSWASDATNTSSASSPGRG